MFDLFSSLIVFILTTTWGWQIVTGKLLDRGGHVWTTRQARPRFFWTMIAIQSLVVMLAWAFLLAGRCKTG